MTTAIELLENPNLDIDPITPLATATKLSSDNELAHLHVGPEDIQKLVLKFQKYMKNETKPGYGHIRQVVRDAIIEDSIDKTPTFTITIYDPDWALLNSGALDGAVDINPGGIPHRWYRLDAFDVNDDEISMVFVTRNAVFLSMHKRPVKYSRGKVTRAQAVLALLKRVKIVEIKLYCPELKKHQPQEKFVGTTEKEKTDKRKSGFTKSDKLTVKARTATPSQRGVISDVIEAGKDLKMPGLFIVCAVMTVIIESTASNNPQPPNPPYVGAFQQNPKMGWAATGNAYKDAVSFYKKGLPTYKAYSNQTLGWIVAKIQGVLYSSNPLNAQYAQKADKWRAEAQHAVNAFGGIDVNDPGSPIVTSTDYRKRYEFMVGEPDGKKHENYLAAIYRWAEEVNWRAYWVRDVLHYISDDDLFKAKARIRLRRYEHGIEGVQINWDRSKKVTGMTLKVRMDRWVCPIGTVVIWDEGSSKTGRGRWLVTNIRRSVFDQLGEITLSKPMHEKKEPAPEAGVRTTTRKTSSNYPLDSSTPVEALDVIATSPKDIIDRIVLPMCRDAGIYRTIAQNNAGNAAHTHLGSKSDHAGPPSEKWAADMSDGFMTPNEKKLTKALCARFGIPYSFPILRSVNSRNGEWRFQIIHGANFPEPTGDHRDHVHFGVRRVGLGG